jgi:hypothetical protein
MADAPQVASAGAPQLAPASDPEVRHRKKSLVTINAPNGQSRVVNLEELSNADAQLAAQFGYKPVFKREFGYLSTFSFAVSISGLFSTIMTTFVYPISAGGSAAAVWCWLISGAGCMCIAVSAPNDGKSDFSVLCFHHAHHSEVIRCRACFCVSHIWRLV